MKKILAITMAALAMSGYTLAEVYPNTNVEVVKKGLENAHENVAPDINQYNKDSGIQARDGLFLPPVVPHSIRGMQVSKNTNRCLECHGPETAPVTGATVLSKTHFYDRQDKLGETVSPRRYFCLQCHVPQTNTPDITEQTYHANKGFNAKEDRTDLPQVTKTPRFEAQFKQTLEDFSHSSDEYLKEAHH